MLEEHGIKVLTVPELLASDPIDPIEVDEDDLALMQLTSGSTGSPKAVQITHRNIYSNAEAMFIGAEYDVEKDVMVSWLPCFHDMGMVGFLTIPMYFGAELVKVTPMDFLRDTLLWARLIDKYKGTMTAAPNFAYALLAKRLRRQAKPGEFDLSTLRFALSGAEPVEPADVEDLLDAGKPFGLTPEAILPAYGMAETTLAVSFSAVRRRPGGRRGRRRPAGRAAPRRARHQGQHPQAGLARPAAGGPRGPHHRRAGQCHARPRRRRHRAARRAASPPATSPWAASSRLRTSTAGTTPATSATSPDNGHIVVCGRVKDVIIMAGRNIYPTDIERAAGRVEGVRPGCAVAVRLDAGHSRETFAVAVESNAWQDPVEVRRIEHQVAHEVVAEVDVRPRNVVVLGRARIPKTPSGKLRRANSVSLVT